PWDRDQLSRGVTPPPRAAVLRSRPVIDLHPGDLVDGRYRVVRLIGRGGWAIVYEGVHLRLPRPAAIKVLLTAQLAKGAAVLERFAREAQAAIRIDSENV